MPATRPSAGVRAIRSSTRAPLALRGDRERAVLDEGARVAEVGDVLARRALAGLAPPRDRVGPRRVERRRAWRCVHLGEIGADVVEVDRRRVRRIAARSTSRGFDEDAADAPRARCRRRRPRAARTMPLRRRRDDVLHLHRVHAPGAAGPARTASPSRTAMLTIVPCIGARREHVPVGASEPVVRRGVSLAGGSDCRRDHRARASCRSAGRRAGRPDRSRRRTAPARCRGGPRAPISAARWSSTKRGVDRDWRRSRGAQQRAQERDVGAHALDARARRARAACAPPRRRSAARSSGRSAWRAASRSCGLVSIAGVAAGVDAHAGAGRQLERGQRAARRAARRRRRRIVSVLMRTCIAKPRGAGTVALARGRARRASGRRRAAAGCAPGRCRAPPRSPCARPAGAGWPR